MRTLYRFSALAVTAFVLFLSFGCGEDSPILPGPSLPPTLTLNAGTGLVSESQELPLNTPSFIINLTGADGDAPLRDLLIQENGLTIPASQLNFRTGETSNNPIATAGSDAQGFTYEIEVTPTNTIAGPVTFTFRLTDTDNEVASRDIIITYTVSPPIIDLLVADGFVSSDLTLSTFNPGFAVRLNLDDTEDSLASLTILEDGTVLDTSRLNYNNGAFTPMNPLTLVDTERAGATFDVRVSPENVTDETRSYTFRVADLNGVTAEQTVNITFETPPGTPLTFDTTGIFFNASGEQNGGLDLDNGTAVAFNSTEAEIQDEGIDLNTAGENWRTQISSVNDAVLRIADLSSLGENTSFDDIGTQEQIATLFTNGSVPDGNDNFPDADGDQSANEEVTQPLREGDVLVVRRGDRDYLVRIESITFVASSNDDGYTVSIKY